jgi:hypothetical protein
LAASTLSPKIKEVKQQNMHFSKVIIGLAIETDIKPLGLNANSPIVFTEFGISIDVKS